jgi:hypothetical protein
MRRVMLVAVLLAGCGKKDEGGGSRPPADRTPADEKPAVSAAADMMWLEFGENPATAEGKYAGKVVSVKGQVHTVLDDGDGWTLNLFAQPGDSNRQPPGTIARFDRSQKDALIGLPPGEEVEVIGRCAGKVATMGGRNGYAVVLENCRLGATAGREPAEK